MPIPSLVLVVVVVVMVVVKVVVVFVSFGPNKEDWKFPPTFLFTTTRIVDIFSETTTSGYSTIMSRAVTLDV